MQFSNSGAGADPFLSTEGMSMSNQSNAAPSLGKGSSALIAHLTPEEEAMIADEAARQ